MDPMGTEVVFFLAPFRYPRSFYETHLPDFDRPETAVLPLPRLYLQAKQLAKAKTSLGVWSLGYFVNQTTLGGGFKYILFSPLFGEDSHFD